MTKKRKNKNFNPNQKSFYFDDYFESTQKNKRERIINIYQDRIYLLFFLFISLIAIFSIKIILTSLKDPKILNYKSNHLNFILERRDIVDRNDILISRNIKSFHAAINPKLVKNKKNLLLNIKLHFPELSAKEIKKKFNKGKYFYLKKRLTQKEKEILWSLGEKGIIFEPFQSRIYTHGNLYSHVLGQVDYDNYGISGIEKFLDKEIKNKSLSEIPIKLSLDTNIQHIVDKELNEGLKIFKATGGAALLMDANNGEIISLVSLPNFDINRRISITDKNYINKITKGIYELGSIFKTFTIALAIEKKLVTSKTIIKDIPKKIKCSVHEISDIKEFPDHLSVEDILIRSSNIGTLMIAKKIGDDNYKKFIDQSNLLKTPKLEIEELGTPIKFNWNKCKLETISYGHGITVTPLQAAAVYGAIANGGNIIQPTLIKDKIHKRNERIFSLETSKEINNILRKVVTDKEGTASLADVHGFYVGGKTGTSQKYKNKEENLNTFISIFPYQDPKYVLLIMLENPKVAKNLIYDYRGLKIRGSRNESGWNSVYLAGKIIKKIGPILAINNKEFNDNYVAQRSN